MKLKKTIYGILLTISLLPSIITNGKTENKEEIVSIEDNIYDDKNVTFIDIRETLQNNQNLEEEYKNYIYEFIDLVEQKYPNINLNIFNENLERLKIKVISLQEMQDNCNNRQAYFKIDENTIYMNDEYQNENIKKYCYFHELWHTFNNIQVIENENVIYKSSSNSNGIALSEGITTLLTEQIFSQDLLCYVNQYDEAKILYEIFGNELLNKYIENGIDGVKELLKLYISEEEILNLITSMDNELKYNTNTLYIYNELIEVYLKSNNFNCQNNIKIYEILENLCYSVNIKSEIIKSYRDNLCEVEINDNTIITFDNKNYYKIQDLYFAIIDNQKFLINDEILISFYKNGYIKNIYDNDKVFVGKSNILIESFEEYIIYNVAFMNIENGIIYVDKNIINENVGGYEYVKSK